MYQSYPSLVIGFHACDKSIGLDLVNGRKDFKASKNLWDWLGEGMYFWENNLERAWDYGRECQGRTTSSVEDPCVVGAVIDLGHCLNLLDHENLSQLRQAYSALKEAMDSVGQPMPQNSGGPDMLHRPLDKAVIEALHTIREEETQLPYDSVRGVFFEGKALYPGAGFREKNHIQLAIRNPNCIKGFFLPRELDTSWSRV